MEWNAIFRILIVFTVMFLVDGKSILSVSAHTLGLIVECVRLK